MRGSLILGLIGLAGVAHATLWDIKIEFFEFVPGSLTVDLGDTVRWTNLDEARHNVHFVDGDAGPLLDLNETWEYTFTATGEFPYFCDPHPWMTASVMVVPEPSALAALGVGALLLLRRRTV